MNRYINDGTLCHPCNPEYIRTFLRGYAAAKQEYTDKDMLKAVMTDYEGKCNPQMAMTIIDEFVKTKPVSNNLEWNLKQHEPLIMNLHSLRDGGTVAITLRCKEDYLISCDFALGSTTPGVLYNGVRSSLLKPQPKKISKEGCEIIINALIKFKSAFNVKDEFKELDDVDQYNYSLCTRVIDKAIIC